MCDFDLGIGVFIGLEIVDFLNPENTNLKSPIGDFHLSYLIEMLPYVKLYRLYSQCMYMKTVTCTMYQCPIPLTLGRTQKVKHHIKIIKIKWKMKKKTKVMCSVSLSFSRNFCEKVFPVI